MKSTAFLAYEGAVPGASVLVLHDGETVLRKSFGLAQVEDGSQATPETSYRLASVTKQFTAMAILLLEERKQLSLDAPLHRFLPEFPAHGGSITVRHLLTHTSGLVDYEDVIPAGTTIPLKDFDVLYLLLEQRGTDFPPGSRFRYSNSGYALLALIVEKVSGQTFARFLHDHLFLPAGMRSVAYEKGLSPVRNRAYGYSREGDSWRRTDQSLTSAVLGDGGIYASIDDMAKWIAFLDANPLFATATKPRTDTDKPPARYGYGWYIGEKRGRGAIWHTGETLGFRNAVLRLPDEKITVVILTNRNEGEPIELALDVVESRPPIALRPA